MATIRENQILTDHTKPLSDRERAIRRLRNPTHYIEVLTVNIPLDVAYFVFDETYDIPTRSIEYHCPLCGAHAVLRFIKVEGSVKCRDGKIEGKPL